jgi:hypothetical protein
MRRARTASGGSEEAARDTARPRTADLEDGVPPPLLKHGIEVLRALATAAASTAERRVARKDINTKPPHGSWQALFDASKPSSLVARGYAAKGCGAGPDYGRYWITAAGLEYLAAVDRAAVADADVDEDLDLVDAAADADHDARADAPRGRGADGATGRRRPRGHARGANLGGVAPIVPQAFRAFADRIHTISDGESAAVIAACDG